jgi:flavin reductase (DIM6/NTAB) family NADH-FMN oxidoreductase RutF
MEVNPDSLSWKSVYKLLTGSIIPRPVGWISTINPQGMPNLAPFSFFNVVSSHPPHLVFAPSIRTTDRSEKDTLRNIRQVGEFVVNIVSEDLLEAMNLTSTELPADIDEFSYAGLTRAPSHAIRPPRVAESRVHFECTLRQIIELGDQPGGGALVIGQVVHIHVDDGVLIGEDKINLESLKPIGRLAGNLYCRVSDLIELPRPKSQIISKTG